EVSSSSSAGRSPKRGPGCSGAAGGVDAQDSPQDRPSQAAPQSRVVRLVSAAIIGGQHTLANPMRPPERLHHVAVVVSDLARSEVFYTEVLGLCVSVRHADERGTPRAVW